MFEPLPPEAASQRAFDNNRRAIQARSIFRLELYVLAIFAGLAWNSCQIVKMERRLDARDDAPASATPRK